MPAQHSYKTLFQVENSPGAGTYTTVKEATELTGPDGSAVVLDVTDLDDDVVTKLSGLPDPGSYSITFNQDLNDAQQTQLRENWAAAPSVSLNFRVIYPDPAAPATPKLTRDFAGKVQSWNVTATQNTQLTVACSVLVLGAITDTAA